MKIKSIDVREQPFALKRPYTIAFRHVEAIDTVTVEVTASDGTFGLGAGSPEPYVTKETYEACLTALQGNTIDWLIGQELDDINSISATLAQQMMATPAAHSAIDIALHDLWAKLQGKRLVDCFGQAVEPLPTSITMGIMDTQSAIAEAKEYIERGFRCLKIKLGHSLEEDIERMHRLREVFPKDIVLRVDPNQGYNISDLQAFFQRVVDLDIEFVEQPLPTADVEQLRNLPQEMRQQIALDENLQTEADALRWTEEPRPAGIYNIKFMKCGGIYVARRIANIAHQHSIDLMWGCMDESIISVTAALHTALSCPATKYIDLDGSFDLACDVVKGGFVLQDGVLHCGPGLGLGVELL